MEKRLNLLSELNSEIKLVNNFIKPDLKNAFGKQYSWDIIFRYYEKFPNSFACIFGDFNKLNVINNKYGHTFGTMAMEKALSLVQSVIPSNSLILRLGGDEFFFIIPDYKKSDCEIIINKIHQILKENSDSVLGLSIELAAEDSSKGNIYDLLSFTDEEVCKRKTYRKEHDTPTEITYKNFIPLKVPNNNSSSENLAWSEINSHINVITYNFLQTLRPSSNLAFSEEQIRDISYFLLSATSFLLKEKSNINKGADSDINLDCINPNNFELNIKNIGNGQHSNLSNIISPDTAKLIHMLLVDRKNVNLDILSDEAIQDLTKKFSFLAEDLVHDKSSSLFTKSYFKLYLANEMASTSHNLYAFYVSIPGIKLSNSAYDYSVTDYRKNSTSSLFLELFGSDISYNEHSFKFFPDDVHMISYGAGDIVIICPEELKETIGSKLETIVSSINSSYNSKNPYGTFPMSYAPKRIKNELTNVKEFPPNIIDQTSVESIISSVKTLNDKADYNKDIFKMNFFKSIDAFMAFKKLLSPLIDTYLNNISNPLCPSNVSTLISNFYCSFLNYEVLHNETRKDIIGHYNPYLGSVNNKLDDLDFCH